MSLKVVFHRLGSLLGRLQAAVRFGGTLGYVPRWPGSLFRLSGYMGTLTVSIRRAECLPCLPAHSGCALLLPPFSARLLGWAGLEAVNLLPCHGAGVRQPDQRLRLGGGPAQERMTRRGMAGIPAQVQLQVGGGCLATVKSRPLHLRQSPQIPQ